MTSANPLRGAIRADSLLTIGAVLLVGFAAGRLVSPSIHVATVLVAYLVWRGTREPATADVHGGEMSFLPYALRSRAGDALERCGGGDARRLLLSVIAHARPLFTRDRAQLNERAEQETIDNVSSLLEACCSTAESLGDLDRVVAASAGKPDASDRAAQMRERLIGQLSGAAATLGELYLAGLEHETDALSRVSQLTAAIREDAAARHAAAQELSRVLG